MLLSLMAKTLNKKDFNQPMKSFVKYISMYNKIVAKNK